MDKITSIKPILATLTNGLEIYAETKALKTHSSRLSIFTATSYFEGFYQKGSVVINGENKSIEGNRLETLPHWISRSGIHFQRKTLSATFQCSHVTESFSDTLNTVTPSADGAKGIIPAYTVFDLNFIMKFTSNYSLKLGVNNFTAEQYFTKRPTGYPGLGIWASDGRSIAATFSFKL